MTAESEFGSRLGLPVRSTNLLLVLHVQAKNTADRMDESWQRPVRHNPKLERSALWHAIALEGQCRRAVGDEFIPTIFPLRQESADAEVRYEVEAATRTIPSLIPFASSELAQLREAGAGAYPETMAIREPELAAEWHRWLWEGGSGHKPDADQGEAAMLGIATRRLADGLHQILYEAPASD